MGAISRYIITIDSITKEKTITDPKNLGILFFSSRSTGGDRTIANIRASSTWIIKSLNTNKNTVRAINI
jgi:hypothetical protein